MSWELGAGRYREQRRRREKRQDVVVGEHEEVGVVSLGGGRRGGRKSVPMAALQNVAATAPTRRDASRFSTAAAANAHQYSEHVQSE